MLYRQADDLPLLAQGVAVTLDGGAPGTLAVIRRVDREYEFLEMLIGLLAALNIAGAVVALIAGRITAGRMLAPLSEMISRAQAIDAHALDTRLTLPPADDELRQLAQTLNAMLDRVQAAFVRQGQFTQDASHELRTPLANTLARTVSASASFAIFRRISPRDDGNGSAALRHVLLSAVLLAASAALLIPLAEHINIYEAKLATEGALFAVNLLAQCLWQFKRS